MIRVEKLVEIGPYFIICKMNNDVLKRLDVEPLINAHSKINGVKSLLNSEVFNTAKVGDLGEVYWKDVVINSSNERWNYDISPEYIAQFGENYKPNRLQ